MAAQLTSNQQELIFYQNIVEAFLDKYYPELDIRKFWQWVVFTLTGQPKTLDGLTVDETNAFLNELKNIGNVLFDPIHLLAALKGDSDHA